MTALQDGNEPAWCTRHHRNAGRHVSPPVQVGEQRDNGQVSARLTKTGTGPTHVVVNVAHMASATVDVSLEDAQALRDGLTGLLRAAGTEP